MAKNLNKAIARALPLPMQVALLGPQAAMGLLQADLKNKVNTKIRALPGTDNAYKIQLRKDRANKYSLIKATGCATYEEALTWIRAARRAQR